MKKILLIVGALLIVIVAAFALAVMNAQKLATRFKPDIERVASKALGAQVTLGAIDVSVFPTVRLVVDETKVAPPHAPKGEGLTLRNLTLEAKLLPLLKGELAIETLSLDRPALVLLRSRDGISVEGLPKKSPEREAVKPEPPAEAKAGAPRGFNLDLEALTIKRALVTVKDAVAGKEYVIRDLNLSSSVALTPDKYTFGTLSIDGTALDRASFSVAGKEITFAPTSGAVEIPGAAIQVLGNTLDVKGSWNVTTKSGALALVSKGIALESFAPLADQIPALASLKPSGTVIPNIQAKADGGSYHSSGTVTLKALALNAAPHEVRNLNGILHVDVRDDQKKVTSDDLSLDLNGAPIKTALALSLAGNNATLEKLTLNAFSGVVNGDGKLALSDAKPFTSRLNGKALQLQPLLAAVLPDKPLPIEGTIQAVETALGGAISDVKSSLNGPVSFTVVDGKIKGINLAGEVLRNTKDLPFVGGAIDKAVPPRLRGELEKPDTEIHSLTAQAAVANQQANVQSLTLVSDIFSLDATGTAGFDGMLDLKATIRFSPEFSRELAASKKEIGRFLNQQGELAIPLVLRGVPPKLAVLPDVSKLAEGAGKEALKEEAGKLLDRLGGKNGDKKGLGKILGF